MSRSPHKPAKGVAADRLAEIQNTLRVITPVTLETIVAVGGTSL